MPSGYSIVVGTAVRTLRAVPRGGPSVIGWPGRRESFDEEADDRFRGCRSECVTAAGPVDSGVCLQ